MANHAATDGKVAFRNTSANVTPRSHYKSVSVVSVSSTLAVARNETEIVISQKFADAVASAYKVGCVKQACEGVSERIITLVDRRLKELSIKGMPRWTNDDIADVVTYLADQGKIVLPRDLDRS